MPYLDSSQFDLVRAFVAPFDSYHPSAQATLNGTAEGQVWVDDAAHPRVAYVEGPEGCYLCGDPSCQSAYAELRGVIPMFAYLLVDPPGWEAVLPQVWVNGAARRHERVQYRFLQAETPPWRDRVPEGMQVVPVDEAFFARESLENHAGVQSWADGWPSRAAFLAHGGGMAVVCGDVIASWCIMDFAFGDRCEIGIITDPRFRRRGLGTLAVSAMLEACRARGYREIGWQCYRTNYGSVGVARRTGFVKNRDYIAYSCWIPGENPGDMTNAETIDWAEHYDRVAEQDPLWRFLAAQAWASAGCTAQAMDRLRALQAAGWKGRRAWFDSHWRLNSLNSLPEYHALKEALIQEE